jgi:hypothetical protein
LVGLKPGNHSARRFIMKYLATILAMLMLLSMLVTGIGFASDSGGYGGDSGGYGEEEAGGYGEEEAGGYGEEEAGGYGEEEAGGYGK